MISVIIVSWNVREYLDNCLTSVVKACKGLNSEIIVVDNASQDKTTEMLKDKFPQIKIIANKKNLGFGRANNQGSRIAKSKYLLFLNPDTIVDRKAIRALVSFLKSHPKAGLVGPEQLDGTGKTIFNFSRWSFRGILKYLIEQLWLLTTGKYKILFPKPYQTKFLNAGCWLVKQEVFEKIGGFNKELFLYGEEPDFCGRLKKAGYQIWFLRNCQIIHFREKSIEQTSKKKQFFIKSYLKIIKQFFTNQHPMFTR